MAMFSKTQMAWSEPYFFIIRLRERWGWTRRGVLVLVIAAVMFAAILVFRNPALGLAKGAALSLAAGLVLVALLDLGNVQREVTIYEDEIFYSSAVGTMWRGSFPLKDIRHVVLMRPQDWKLSCGAMLIQTDDDVFLLGVPNKVSLATIANVLHRLGVSVALEGWEPSTSDTRVQVKDEVILPAGAAGPSGPARIWPVDEHEARLNPPAATAVAVVIALGPLFLSLVGAIAAGVYVFLKWGELAVLTKWAIGGGALAGLVVSFFYLVLAGQFLASRYLIGVAKGVMRTRPGARLHGTEEDLIPVEIFDRTAWTSTVSKSNDFGFLEIDAARRRLALEGDKHRWEIPTAALTTCRIEEAHVGREDQNAEKRYYVVIACDRDGEPWEAGMIPTRTELGNDGKEQRYARAQALLGRISEVVSRG